METSKLNDFIHEIVEYYKFLSSGSHSEQWSHIVKLQSQISKIIEFQLSDFNALTAPLNKSTSTNTEMVLKFIQHLMSNFHYVVFVPSGFEQLSTDQIETYTNFQLLLMDSLIRVLPFYETANLQLTAVETLKLLLSLINTKNSCCYYRLLSKIHTLIQSLSVMQTVYIEDSSTNLALCGTLHVTIKARSELNCLFCNLTLLTEVFTDMGMAKLHTLEWKSTIWRLLFYHMVQGNAASRTAAFVLCKELLNSSGLPTQEDFHQLMNCLFGIMEYKMNLALESSDDKSDEEMEAFYDVLKSLFNIDLKVINCEFKTTISNVIPLEYIRGLVTFLGISTKTISENEEKLTNFEFVIKIMLIISRYIHDSFKNDCDSFLLDYSTWCEYGLVDNFKFVLDKFINKKIDTGALDVIVSAMLWEIKYFCSHPQEQNSIQDLKMTYIVCMGFQNFLNELFKIKSITADNAALVIEKFETYICYLNIFNMAIYSSHAEFNGNEHLKTKYCERVFKIVNKIYNKDAVLKLIKACIKYLATLRKNVVLDQSNLPCFISIFSAIVNLFKPVITCVFMLQNYNKNLSIEEQIVPSLAILYAIPWLTTGNTNEINSLFSAVKWMPKSEMLQISDSLSQAGLNFDPKEINANKVPCDIILSCLKMLSMIPNNYSLRCRSTIVIKWSLCQNNQTIISNAIVPIHTLLSNVEKSNAPYMSFLKSEIGNLLKAEESVLTTCVQFPLVLLINSYVKALTSSQDFQLRSVPKTFDTNKQCNNENCLLRSSQDQFYLKLSNNIYGSEKVNVVPKSDMEYLCYWLTVVTKKLKESTDSVCGKSVWQIHLGSIWLCLCAVKSSPITSKVEQLMSTWLENLSVVILSEESPWQENNLKAIMREVLVMQNDKSTWNSLFMNTVTELMADAKERKNYDLMCVLLQICGAVADLKPVHSNSKLMDWSIEKLCHEISSSQSLIASSSYLQLEYVTKSVGDDEFFKLHRQLLCSCLTKNLILNLNSTIRPSLQILHDYAQLFHYSAETFVSMNLQFILPPTVTSDKNSELLHLLCGVVEKSATDVLMENFKFIFCYAVVHEQDFKSLFEFLESKTRINEKSLVLINFGGLVHHLLSYISVNYEAVHKKLQMISTIKNTTTKNQSISEMLSPHFLGFITFLNGQLRTTAVMLSEKSRMLESFVKIMQLIDPSSMSAVRIKILNTISLAQNIADTKDWKHLCCRAWNHFLHCIEESCLAPILSQVVVTLLPLLDDFPQEVSKLLTYLVVDNFEHTKENLHELYFLPQHTALKNVQHAIDKQTKIKYNGRYDLMPMLKQAIELTSHKSSDIRLQAFQRLQNTLTDHQESLQHHITQTAAMGIPDATLSQIVVSLLTNCRDTNKSIRLLAAKCLGLIGAIDPDRFIINLPQDNNKSQSYFQIDDMDFAFDLISEIVKAFLASKPSHQDITAYALQELLKIYNCKEGTKDSLGRKLWRRFSENVQEVLEPHLTSRYILKINDAPLSKSLQQAILTRKTNITFREWIGSFCATVMQMVYSSHASSTAGRVFSACAAVVRNDINVSLYLLPHAFLYAVIKSEHANFLQQEVMTVLEATQNQNPSNSSMTQGTTISGLSMQEVDNTNQSSHQQIGSLAAQAVFSLIDHATHFIRDVDTASTNPQAKFATSRLCGLDSIRRVKAFLKSIPQMQLSHAAFACRSHTRALMHYEMHQRALSENKPLNGSVLIEETNNSNTQSVDFLQQLFVEMDEGDGVAGASAVSNAEPTIISKIKQLESIGSLQDAMSCYEQAIANEPEDVTLYKDYIKCLADLGQYSNTADTIEGKLMRRPDWTKELQGYRLESAWQLSRWEDLEQLVSLSQTNDVEKSWHQKLSELLLSTKNQQWDNCEALLTSMYNDQTGPLSAASMEIGSYQRGYEYILRLHMISEIETFINVSKSQSLSEYDPMEAWQLRTKAVQTSFRSKEPIYSLRRALIKIQQSLDSNRESSKCKTAIGRLWLQSAKCARKCGFVQTSFNALINAQKFKLPEFCIEHAKWLWKKGESHEALLTLQNSMNEHYSGNSECDNMSKAKATLLVGRLMEESSSFDSSKVIQQFKEVTAYMNEWEDAHFFRGKYYDKLLNIMSQKEAITLGNFSVLYHIMTNYGQSLRYGSNHIYESLTKLLTIWFDFAAKVISSGANVKQTREMHDNCSSMIAVISKLRDQLPAYVFLVGFSQLVSRICHQHMPTFAEVKELVVKVIIAYPQQALWSLMAISKSSYPERAQRCKQIFNLAEKKDPKLVKFFRDATRLTDELLDLCNRPCPSAQSFRISAHFKKLQKLVQDSNFSQVLIPLQRLMTVTLPQSSRLGENLSISKSQHNPFHEMPAHVIGFEDLVEVLPSLQRPKKISILGSDGNSYLFLCKPKDDLRKDARLMEFNTIVNKYLNKDPDSRKRQLKIRTYAVVPLNEECGLIEWVPNTQGLRHILLKIYKSKNIYCSPKILKKFMLPNNAPLERKLNIFQKELLPRHPAVFKDWFLSTFPNPTQWYNARLAYSRSTAVISMVGYILGLGDRHGENILFDSTNGDTVHVDFNCLFNKGLTLDVPEVVPFRLTHNMVDAMGPVKYEGFFRIACETTMKILREQKEPLLSVLKTFIYDPLVEWSRKSRNSKGNTSTSSEGGEIVNEKAKNHINEIDKRLRGITSSKNKGLPLSIPGHVHFLIQEATDENNLCRMYVGWTPFM